MMPIESYKHLGLLAIVLGITGLSFLLYKWPNSKSKTFSQHAAATKGGRLLYIVLFSLALPPFYLFAIKWLVPTYDLPTSFMYLLTVAVVGQLIAAYVPVSGGWKTVMHNIGAYAMHVLLVPLSLLVFLSQQVSMAARIIALATVIYMLIVWFLLVFVKSSRQYSLYLQSLYVAMFWLTILSATYL